jgi:hypothetical protein
MKVLKVVAVIVFGPLLGLALGFFLGGLFLSHDPTGRGSPGDGFLLLCTSGLGFAVSCLGSVLLAVRIWRNSASSAKAREVPLSVSDKANRKNWNPHKRSW